MIRNREEQLLFMDYGNVCVPCSDIDIMHVTKGGTLVLGEIKNEHGKLDGAQRDILARIVDNYKPYGIVIFITHSERVQDGADSVDVSACKVKEYYWNGRWRKPNEETTVNEIMQYMEVRSMGATIEGKAKVWAKDHDWGTTYTIGVSSKDQNGNWVNAYQPVRFRKDTPKIESGTEINYKAFATVAKGKEYPYVLWQITEYTFVGNEAAVPNESNFSPLSDNDIPF